MLFLFCRNLQLDLTISGIVAISPHVRVKTKGGMQNGRKRRVEVLFAGY